MPPRYFKSNPYAGHELFAVVRDPYARIISEFRCPWKGFQAPMQVPKARRNQRHALRASATAAELNAWVVEQLRGGRARPPFKSGHLIPQHMYIFNDSGERLVSVHNVLRFEQLIEQFAQFAAKHKLPDASLEQTNESEMKRFSLKDLSLTARRLIEEEYSEDFKLFGYAKRSH